MTATTAHGTNEDAATVLARLHALLTEDDLEGVHAQLIGRRLLLEGCATSYEAKCRIEKAAQTLALPLESSLRVIPAALCGPPIHS
jgi:hypothetical protein